MYAPAPHSEPLYPPAFLETQVLKARPRCVPTGSTAHIRITCQRSICIETYGDCRALGRFVLRQKGATVAVGLVLDTEIR